MLNFETCKAFYKNYRDVFDVLLIISNAPRDKFEDGEVGYFGKMSLVRNDVLDTRVGILD